MMSRVVVHIRPTWPISSTVAALAIVAAAALAILGLPRAALAQRPAPTIEGVAAFDPPSATIGDQVTLTVRITHPDDAVVKVTAPKIGDVDLIGTAAPLTAPVTPGTATPLATTFTFTMQPFATGTLDTGTIRVSWLRSDGTSGGADTPGAKLIVVPVRAANDEALRPLKPQAAIGGGPPVWVRSALAAAVLLALAVAASLVALLARGRGEPEAAAAPVDHSPEGRARQALDALGLVLGGAAAPDYEAYYGGIALTVRTYLAARFGFNAHALTTTELEHRMVRHGVDRWQARLVAGLLERCDDAVYARRYPDPASADHDLTVAYEIVELSRPRATGEGQAAPA